MEILFIIKKLIASLLMPFSIGLIIFSLGIYFVLKKKVQKGKWFLVTGFIWIAIVSHSSFANFILQPLENSYQKLNNIPKDTKYIVFLGGDMENRGWEVLRIYKELGGAKIITSGYEGRGETPEAIKSANILREIGIKEENIIQYPKPKDTKEEAKNIKEVLKDEPFVLVTSAYHMKRAMLIFKQEGLLPTPAPTDFLIKDSDSFISLPDGYSLNKTQKAWHEYIGLFWANLVMFLVE